MIYNIPAGERQWDGGAGLGGAGSISFGFPITKHAYIDKRKYSSHKMVSLCRFNRSPVFTNHCHRKFVQLDRQKCSDIQPWVGPPRDLCGGASPFRPVEGDRSIKWESQTMQTHFRVNSKCVNAAVLLFGQCVLWLLFCRLECCIVLFLCKSDMGGNFMLSHLHSPKWNKFLNTVQSNSAHKFCTYNLQI